jgi:hypothetical protein
MHFFSPQLLCRCSKESWCYSFHDNICIACLSLMQQLWLQTRVTYTRLFAFLSVHACTASPRARNPYAGLPNIGTQGLDTRKQRQRAPLLLVTKESPTPPPSSFSLGHPPQAVPDCTNSCACMQLLHGLGALLPASRTSCLKALDARLQRHQT